MHACMAGPQWQLDRHKACLYQEWDSLRLHGTPLDHSPPVKLCACTGPLWATPPQGCEAVEQCALEVAEIWLLPLVLMPLPPLVPEPPTVLLSALSCALVLMLSVDIACEELGVVVGELQPDQATPSAPHTWRTLWFLHHTCTPLSLTHSVPYWSSCTLTSEACNL